MNTQPNNPTVPILILVIVLLLIAGGYYIYSNKSISPDTQNITTETENVVVDDSALPTNNTSTIAPGSATPISPNATPSIKIINPNGGEMWKEGQTQVVQWSAQNIVGNQSVKLVDLNNRVVLTITSDIAANNTSTGLYQISWVLPQEFVSEASPIKYKILVSANNGLALDYSDTPFTIYASGSGL